MDEARLILAVTGPETERLERKESLVVDRIRQAICAGLAIARAALRRNGNVDPQFLPTPTHVLANVRFE